MTGTTGGGGRREEEGEGGGGGLLGRLLFLRLRLLQAAQLMADQKESAGTAQYELVLRPVLGLVLGQ